MHSSSLNIGFVKSFKKNDDNNSGNKNIKELMSFKAIDNKLLKSTPSMEKS